MESEGRITEIGSARARSFRAVILVSLVVVGLVAYHYDSSSVPIQHELGNAGLVVFIFFFGCYSLWETVSGVRTGNVAGYYLVVWYKRAESPFMFWFMISFHAFIAALCAIGAPSLYIALNFA
jgi:hypothetical protein